MFNLLYYQIVVQLCTTLTEFECNQIIEKYSSDQTVPGQGFTQLGTAMAFVLVNMNKCKHLRPDSVSTASGDTTVEAIMSSTSTNINLNLMEQQLQKLCLPFLRIAALLRHHLYEQDLPEIKSPQLEFVRLVYFVELVTDSMNWGMDWDSFNAAKALCFIPGTEQSLPKLWCDQLMDMKPLSTIDPIGQIKATTALISNQHALWQQPRLLGLPREYERLFTVSLNDAFLSGVINSSSSFCFPSSIITNKPV